MECSKLFHSYAFLFFLLLLGQLEFFVTCAPELSEFLVFLLGSTLFFILALDLELSAAFDGEFHLHFAAFLLLEESVGFVFSLSDLLVEDAFFFVSNSSELLDLMVNHSLTFLLFFGKALRFLFLLHEVSSGFLPGEIFDLLFFGKFLLSGKRLNLDLLLVGRDQVGLHLLSTLLTGKLTLFLTLKIFVYLALDEFTFEHFFLKCLDVVKFEFLELVGDLLGVGDFVFVLNFELGLHLFIVCDHLFFFHFNPLSINLFLNFFFTSS